MNREEAEYVIKHYSHLLSGSEKPCVKECFAEFAPQHSNSAEDFNKLNIMYRAKGWIKEHEDTSVLFKNGIESFEEGIALRIIKNFPDQVILNYCPKCGSIARTPTARQCRCGNSWH